VRHITVEDGSGWVLGPAGISLNLSTGAVSILRKISSNTYTLRYRICERSSPSNCSEANVSLYTSGGL